MNGYTQLTIEQRYQIDGLKKAGFSQTEISGELKFISRHISSGFTQQDELQIDHYWKHCHRKR